MRLAYVLPGVLFAVSYFLQDSCRSGRTKMEFVGVSHKIYSPCSFSTLNSVHKSRYLQISRAGGVLPHNLLCSDEVSSRLRIEFGTLVQLHNPFLRCSFFNTSIPVRSCPALYEKKKIALQCYIFQNMLSH